MFAASAGGRRLASLATLFVVVTGSGVGRALAQDPMPMVQAMETAMGGKANMDKMRFLRFDWVVEKNGTEVARARHLWDRSTGRYRVEWRARDGRQVLSLLNVNTQAGRVWVNGAAATPQDSTDMLKRAYARYINDTYWLLMPWKLEDPGAKVESAGKTTVDGQEYELLHVSFDNVGLTPGDQYWAYINPSTHRMDRWAYFLQGTEGTPSIEAATAWNWSDWRSSGDVLFACERHQVGAKEGERIYFPVVQAMAAVDDKVFTSPEVPLPGDMK
jgi:uncharacterized protein DUF6503